ncbi:CHAT domain-containing protein [Streptomyces mangrovisoli]|uniref:CHAT domain-containing protein n=1 Tax=Streptomyces mangrovisoli TaxID=1428628 RepID=A0A1J4NVA8_9ACTN|nr:CHAT domain-containing protein [Streptomyces mangrovisoli]OIJ65157.1 CHAT domain-containing protein [Streptomyces mangrovisoli]
MPDDAAELSALVAEIAAERDRVLDDLSRLSSGDPDAPALCGYAGELSYRLHALGHGDDEDAVALDAFEHAFGRPGPADDPMWSAWRVIFGHLRAQRYDEARPDRELLSEVVELLGVGADGLPPDDPDFDPVREVAHALLVACTRERYERRTPADDEGALLDDALTRHHDALSAADPAIEGIADLRVDLGLLHIRRFALRGDLDDAAASARHYRAALDGAHPVAAADVPQVWHSAGVALMLHGRATEDRRELESARDAFDTALTELRRSGADAPEWAWEVRCDAVFIRATLWAVWKDQAHGAAAEVELTRLLAVPGAEDRLLPPYLDVFGRLLYERAAERDDAGGRDRAIALLRHALDTWDPARDGDSTVTAMFLAFFQQARYPDDPDPGRARDVLEGVAPTLRSSLDVQGLRPMALLMDAWARYRLVEHGLLAEREGVPEGLDVEGVLSAYNAMNDDLQQGRSHFDFGEDEHLPGFGRDVTGSHRRQAAFDQVLAGVRATEPGSEARARLASMLLGNLIAFDPDGRHVTADQRRELIEAVFQRVEQDPAWLGKAHAVAGVSLLGAEMAGSGSGLDAVLAHFDQAEAAGQDSGRDYGVALARLAAQTRRGQTGGAADDMEAGAEAWRRLREDPTVPRYLRQSMDLQQASHDAFAATRRGDLAAADRSIVQLATGHAEMSDEDPSRIQIYTLMENARAARDHLAETLGVPPLAPPAHRPGVLELRRQAARLPRDHRAWVLGDNGVTRFGRAGTAQDGPGLSDAARLLQEAYDLSDPGSDNRLRYANCLGMAHCVLASMQIDRVHRRERLARGIALLEGALAEAGGPEHRLHAPTGLALARAYRDRDDPHRRDRAAARRVGLDSLRGHAWAALLQSGTGHAELAAAQATTAALEVAGWCLKDDRPEEALRALDACRGLVLHAAVISTSVPDLLTAAGHTDLAAEWRASGADSAGLPQNPGAAVASPLGVPSSLRRRVLAALTPGDSPQTALLLDPPAPEEIGRALRSLGKDALVYLVPASEDVAGTAVVVTSGGAVHAVPLPTLTETAAPLKEYTPATAPLDRTPTGPTGRPAPTGPPSEASTEPPAGPPWGPPAGPGPEPRDPRVLGPVPGFGRDASRSLRRQLDRLCGWAWYAGMRPLLEAFEMPSGRLPRLVLVPMGALGLVPWHAAWEAGGPRGRQYALQAAEISYAASARLLCQVAARPAAARPGAALFVGNPTGDLYHAGEEADAVQRVFYPDGRFLGHRTRGAADGPGTPGEVLDWLRSPPAEGEEGGGVLHLACHASVAAGARRSAYLSLSDGQLAAEELTEAVAADDGRLGLVLLAACRSHVSGRGHNEAYSLATAFLVAGARSVVGSLWPVPDEATSVLMFLTHHFLRTHGEPPGRALRRAQLWMIDPDRELPAQLPAELAERAARIDPHDLSAWAGFTHLGQ